MVASLRNPRRRGTRRAEAASSRLDVARVAQWSAFLIAMSLLTAVGIGAAMAQNDSNGAPALNSESDTGGVLDGLSADGPLEITVTGGEFRPIPIAAPEFLSGDSSLGDVAADIRGVVMADLERSGLFKVVPGGSLTSIDVPPSFVEWRGSGAEALIAGEVAAEADGRIGVRFRLWDLALNQQIEQLKFLSAPSGWRRVSHKVADVIYSNLTGEGPYFDSRVVFVEERGPKDNRRKRLAMMDSDGANLVYLTDDAELVLTPRFSPVGQEITFISYKQGHPEIYLLNLSTERQELLGEFPGMTFAPRFSPDGDRVMMSLTRNGDTDIYLMDLSTRRIRQLTKSAGIDTAPSFAPDGSAIAFESDRGATQQLYVMDPDGANQRRISFGEGRYATPVWSPRGDLIAFTKMERGRFHIGVMRPDGSEERLLTSSFLDEGPTWSPNGRVIMFFRETPGAEGRPQLYSVDVSGRNLLRLATPAGASDPAWSPLLGPPANGDDGLVQYERGDY